VLPVAEVEPLRVTRTKDGDDVTVTTVFLEVYPIGAHCVLHAWGGSGAERLAELHAGDICEFSQISVHSQPAEKNRQRGHFAYVLYYTTRKASSVHVIGRRSGPTGSKLEMKF